MNDDLISRHAAIDAIRKIYDSVGILGEKWAVDKCQMAIKDLPSAQRWIPCSERLPENRLYVLVTYKYEYGLIDHGITWYGQAEEKWDTSREVIAWMPLPEPYREGEQDENR